MCVCVLFPIYFGDRPTDQGETCTLLCSVIRGLHFAAFFSVLLNQPGSHRRVNTRTYCSTGTQHARRVRSFVQKVWSGGVCVSGATSEKVLPPPAKTEEDAASTLGDAIWLVRNNVVASADVGCRHVQGSSLRVIDRANRPMQSMCQVDVDTLYDTLCVCSCVVTRVG